MSTIRASQCLLSRIARAALSEYGNTDFYVVPSPGHVVLGDGHLKLLTQPEETWLQTPESVARLVEISKIVDSIQSDPARITTPPELTRGFLSDVFPRLLQNVKFLPAPLSNGDRLRYEQALRLQYVDPPFLRTAGYEEFCVLRVDLEKKDVALAELRASRERTMDGPQREAIDIEIASLSDWRREAAQVLEALDHAHGFSRAEAIVDAAERSMDELPASVDRALSSRHLIADPISREEHVACSFFPAQLTEGSWARLRLTRTDIEAVPKPSVSAVPADGDEALSESEIESIDCEIQSVVCERPWLWHALFENPRWSWSVPSLPVARGGDLAKDDGLIPAYVHALVFVRNLVVRRVDAQGASGAARAEPRGITRSLRSEALAARGVPTLLLEALDASSLERSAPSVQPALVETVAAATRNEPQILGLARARSAPVVEVTPAPDLSRMNSLMTTKAAVALSPFELGQAVRSELQFRRRLGVSGRVIDEAGNGIYQATVTLQGHSAERMALTGADGTFHFGDAVAGEHRIVAEKTGFGSRAAAVAVPQLAAAVISLAPIAACKVIVRLVETRSGVPFLGRAKVQLQTGNASRLEAMGAVSEMAFFLPEGDSTISVTSDEAESVSPVSRSVTLESGASAPTLMFEVRRAALLQNPKIQLLAFVCRRVRPCPLP